MSYDSPSTGGYDSPTGMMAAGESAGGLTAWRRLTAADFDDVTVPLHAGTAGAFLDALTYDGGTGRWTATWKATHPGNAPALRQSERHAAQVSAVLPDFVADGNWGIAVRVTVHSLTNTGTRAALMVGVADADGTDNVSGRALGAFLDDVSGTQTTLTGCDATIKKGGSVSYVGVPDEVSFSWEPTGDPTVHAGGAAKVDFWDTGTHVQTATPGDTTTPWSGNLVVWVGFGGQGVGSGGQAVYSIDVRPYRWRLDSP